LTLRGRPRRWRRSEALRGLAQEVRLHAGDLVAPLFVEPGRGRRTPLPSIAGQHRFSPDTAAEEAARLEGLGVGAVLLFGVPSRKDPEGGGAWDAQGPVPEALRAIARAAPGIVRMADCCLCAYTDHGHCGVLDASGRSVDNDATLPLLGRTAAALAEAGYQMDPANRREALREVRLDLDEGADAVLVKPALPCLDLVAAVAASVEVPVAAYQVSGEHAMLHDAAAAGHLDLEAAARESLLAIRRAGARWVVTYLAGHAARALGDGSWAP
jgi:porphobilinogen synthase